VSKEDKAMKDVKLTQGEKKSVYEMMCVKPLGDQNDDSQKKAWYKLVDQASGMTNSDFDKLISRICEEGKGSSLSDQEYSGLSLRLSDCHN